MTNKTNRKQILIFIFFAYGIAWGCAAVIYFTGGLVNSPKIAGAPGLTLAFVLLATVYMGAPAAAHIITRLTTREGWHDLYLTPKFRQGWKYWLLCWLTPGLLTVGGAVLYFYFFPNHFDPSLSELGKMLQSKSGGKPIPLSTLWTIIATQTGMAFLIAPIVNAAPVFGEEFGWRAYLVPKLIDIGERKALLLSGIIWGIWHAPVIAMGHNYGFDYPGYPWTGMLMMVWFTTTFGTLIGWATLRSGSVWPGVIGHGAINGIAAVSYLLMQGKSNPLLGPTPVGIIGSSFFALVAIIILLLPSPVFHYSKVNLENPIP
jgi:membrane protease YdiL (CAAX protease family)